MAPAITGSRSARYACATGAGQQDKILLAIGGLAAISAEGIARVTTGNRMVSHRFGAGIHSERGLADA